MDIVEVLSFIQLIMLVSEYVTFTEVGFQYFCIGCVQEELIKIVLLPKLLEGYDYRLQIKYLSTK